MAESGEPRAPDPPARQAHVVMDLPSRQWKGRKIEQLLGLGSVDGPRRMLEVGTGSGGIAHYFATHPSGRFDVDAVDVVDNRMVSDDFRFTAVHDTTLPFADDSFDIVLSNHVIEHVGDRAEQLRHLAELRRVLKPGGIGYLAVPNRWMLVEPHFQLAFLSWLPKRWRDGYVRLRNAGERYDCEPLEMRELEAMLRESRFTFTNLCVPALHATLAIERPGSRGERLANAIPDRWLQALRGWIPTLIYTFRRDDGAGAGA